jgi:hypothetical protein
MGCKIYKVLWALANSMVHTCFNQAHSNTFWKATRITNVWFSQILKVWYAQYMNNNTWLTCVNTSCLTYAAMPIVRHVHFKKLTHGRTYYLNAQTTTYMAAKYLGTTRLCKKMQASLSLTASPCVSHSSMQVRKHSDNTLPPWLLPYECQFQQCTCLAQIRSYMLCIIWWCLRIVSIPAAGLRKVQALDFVLWTL